jgi:hypothetical protein
MIYDDAWLMTHCIGCIDCVIGTHSSSVSNVPGEAYFAGARLGHTSVPAILRRVEPEYESCTENERQADRANQRAA